MKTQSKNTHTAGSAGKRGLLGFSYTSDWLRKWREFSGPVTAGSKTKPMQSWITFDTLLKIALFSY